VTHWEAAIARTVAYASLFDYPVTLEQLRHTLIESEQTSQDIRVTYASSPALQVAIERRDGFFFPRGRYDLVAERRRRETQSRAFLEDHRRLLEIVCALPFVRMVALSGSIAHLNLDGTGDLDLFIVTRSGRVWLIAVAVVLLAKLMRRRRTLCANFIVSDSRLELEQKDLFTASQIIHLKPLVGEQMLDELAAANAFVASYYPNARSARPSAFPFRLRTRPHRVKRILEAVLAWPSSIAESVCRRAYRRYLLRRAATWQSPDQVRLEYDCLKLHTHSHRRPVLERFDAAVKQMLRHDEARWRPQTQLSRAARG